MAALETTLREELHRNVRCERREVEREVIVARGRPMVGDAKTILIYAEDLRETGVGGGSGSLEEFLSHVGDKLGMPLVGEVSGGEGQRISWENREDADYTHMDSRLDELTAKVLKNLTNQTGLSFTREKRTIGVWLVE
jgi:hypothetical protein